MSQDTQLQQAVLAEFTFEPSINAANIGVIVRAGVVTLTGTVESYAEKIAADTVARRVRGVKAIAEEIVVQLPFDHIRSDTEIATAIIERLNWDVSVPRDSVKVKVESGWVTLTGEVGWHYQSEAAERDVRGLHGVVGVSNRTTVKAAVDTVTLSDDIAGALHRAPFFNPDNIQVSANGGNVRLTGTVKSLTERDVASVTAWSARGTTSVENEIAVV